MPLLPTIYKTYYWISGTLFILVALKVLLYSDGYTLFLGSTAGTFKTTKTTDYKIVPQSRLKDRAEHEDQIHLMIREIQEKMVVMNSSVQMYNISCNETSIDGTEDILCMVPPRFLQAYKNPCWYSRTGRFKCLPYFQLIGAGKCASSDMFARVIKHPDALGNSGTRHKETFWWSWYRYGIRMDTLKRSKKLTFEDYLRYFRSSAKVIEKNPGRGYITGDGSPMDLSDNCGWPSIPQNNRLNEPKFTTAHLIRHINPDVKLLVILREPVNRSYSDYIFRGTGPKTAEGFHHAVVTAIKILHTCTRSASLRACLYDRKLHFRSPARLHMGFYFVFLQDWFRVFPREQFHIIRTEDYSRHMLTYLKEVYRFLGLRDLPPTDMEEIVKSEKKWVTHRKDQAGEMYTETRKILQDLYGTYNVQLAGLLQDNSFTWHQ